MQDTQNPGGQRRHVVIIGGGFGGLWAARALAKAPVKVTLVDRNNYHLFQPLLYQVATAGLSPADIAQPIRNILHAQRNVEVLMAEVTGIDTGGRRVLTRDIEVPYDYLIVATGSHYNYFGHHDWEHLAPSIKSIPDATAIRRDILLAFETAEKEEDPQQREALMTFALVGAGPTGVEMAGAIAELAHRALASDFRRINPRSARILLLEAGPRVLAPFDPKLSEDAKKELERLGVEVRVNAKVESVDERGVVVSGERIASRNVIWTAGVVASPAGQWLGAPTDHTNRVMVQPDCSVPGHPEVFVIGDSAHFEQDGHPLPGLAQVAMQQGTYVAHLIVRREAGKPAPAPFHYHDKGILATVGRSFALAQTGRIKASGFFAWLLWLGVHIWYLIGFRNRVSVLLQWIWAYLAYQRGARLITIETRPVGMSAQEKAEQLSDGLGPAPAAPPAGPGPSARGPLPSPDRAARDSGDGTALKAVAARGASREPREDSEVSR